MSLAFYFDYISPNAYLAWSQLEKLQNQHNISFVPVPVLFTGLLRAHGQMGPAEQPAKQRWMAKNIARKAQLLGIELSPPKFHPFNPLLALRISALPMPDSQRWALVDALMRGAWVEQKHLSDEADLLDIISRAGLDAHTLLEQAKTETASKTLSNNTNEAIDKGVFGIPSIIYKDDVYFGYDDMAYLGMALEQKDPADSEQSQRWMSTRHSASSMRKETRHLLDDKQRVSQQPIEK